MSVAARLVLLALGFLAPAAALGGWLWLREAPPAPPGLDGFPRAVGPWLLKGKDMLSADERTLLVPDSYLAWHYEAEGRLPVSVYVALYRAEPADASSGAHDPALCYPASGWEVTETRVVEVRLPDGERFPGRLLTAHQGNLERKTLYWFQPAARWPGSAWSEQIARIGDSLRGHSQFAFVRLSVPLEVGAEGEGDLLEFAGEIGWPIRRALSGDVL